MYGSRVRIYVKASRVRTYGFPSSYVWFPSSYIWFPSSYIWFPSSYICSSIPELRYAFPEYLRDMSHASRKSVRISAKLEAKGVAELVCDDGDDAALDPAAALLMSVASMRAHNRHLADKWGFKAAAPVTFFKCAPDAVRAMMEYIKEMKLSTSLPLYVGPKKKGELHGIASYLNTAKEHNPNLQRQATLLVDPGDVRPCLLYLPGFSTVVGDVLQHAQQWCACHVPARFHACRHSVLLHSSALSVGWSNRTSPSASS